MMTSVMEKTKGNILKMTRYLEHICSFFSLISFFIFFVKLNYGEVKI